MDAPFPSYICLLAGVVALATLSPHTAPAQPASPASERADTSEVAWQTSLPPLTVTASRIPTSPAQAPARLTVLDSTALHVSGGSSVADLLADRAGLYVRRYGTGGLATPALRGTGASQTVLLLDGQRVTDPQIGHLDLSLLPTVLLRSVRVMHGPASAVHGSNGLGGAIQLRTVRPPSSSVTAHLTAEAGAYGSRGGSLLLGGAPTKTTSLLLAGGYHSTDGDFPYRDDSQYPSTTVRRRNADRTRHTLYGSLRSRMDHHKIRVSGWFTHAERGLPPIRSSGSAQERQWDTQLRVWGRDQFPLANGHLTVQGLTQYTRVRYANPPQNIDQTGKTGLASIETTLHHPLSPRWRIVGGVSGSYARARHPRLEQTPHQKHLSAFAEGTAQYGRVTVYPTLRTDVYWMPAGKTRVSVNPRLGLNAQPVPGWPGVHLKAQLGRAFRVPTFNDRYWQPGGTPDLRPEHSWGGDLGVRVTRRRGHVELTTFGHLRTDQIVWVPTDQGHWSPTNVGRVRALGLEGSMAWTWNLGRGAGLRGDLIYTLTDARNRTDPTAPSYDERLLHLPRHQLKSHVSLTWGPAALDLTGQYMGRRPLTSDGARYLEDYVRLDAQLRLSHAFGDVQSGIALRLDNVLNTTYQSMGGRPMPPRHGHVRVFLAL